MRYSPEYLRDVLPKELPPPQRVPGEVMSYFAKRDGFDDPDLIRRSAHWTYAIFAELRRGEWSLDAPASPAFASCLLRTGARAAATAVSVGVLDQDYEQSGFGIILTLPWAEKSEPVGTVVFPQLKDTRFPVAIRALAEDPHAAPSLPNATTTCWAEDRKLAGRWGFVTCRHALAGVPVNANVPLIGGGVGRVLRKNQPTIDAAFIETAAPAVPPNPLPLFTYPTTGLALSVHIGSGPASASVVSVTDTLGVIDDPHHPIKVYIDKPCSSGDSGSLVTTGSDGVGIYCGELSSATVAKQAGQTVGFAQHLEQAAKILDFNPYL